MKRRHFIRQLGTGAVLLSAGGFPLPAFALGGEAIRLTILHTNDVHSRIEPFPADGSSRAGQGGAARRAAIIKQIRKEEEHVLLLDAGDIFQGTPYFNYFHGEVEMKLMSAMGYDAATIGNHDFDAGIEGLAKQMDHADFPLLTVNYDFSDTVLAGRTKPYQVFRRGPLKIGVFGVGIQLEGLVPKSLTQNTRYLDPWPLVQQTATFLKEEERCDYVICLSHLGYETNSNRIVDLALAKRSRDIDLIIGGHSHTFLSEPTTVQNAVGKPVLVNQVGWGGLLLGRLDVYFERNGRHRCVSCDTLAVGAAQMSPIVIG